MTEIANPALEAFVDQLDSEVVVAQVLVLRLQRGFELRHALDRSLSEERLTQVSLQQLREIAQKTQEGAFRPLKSAPTLRRGWRAILSDEKELGIALDHLYPGALADWFATRQSQPPVTNYRPFSDRQSGIYRITQKLNDEQVAESIRSCCEIRFCLKQRLWTVAGVGLDSAEGKSIIPCLEPCTLFLELARTTARKD